jgi:hypothetical protein
LALCAKGEQPAAPKFPAIEYLDGTFQQPLRYAMIPEFRQHRERPEEPKRAPAREDIGADQPTIDAGREDSRVRGPPSRRQQISISHKLHGIWQAEKGSKGQPYNANCLPELTLAQGADLDCHVLRHEKSDSVPGVRRGDQGTLRCGGQVQMSSM